MKPNVFLYSIVYIDDDTLILVSYHFRLVRSMMVSLCTCICRVIVSEMVAIKHHMQLCMESRSWWHLFIWCEKERLNLDRCCVGTDSMRLSFATTTIVASIIPR
jgi:hypothetical protein